MKKILCALSLLPTIAFSQTVNEYTLSNALTKIKADQAYLRGYTGKNSVIAILDSGIDGTNIDFKNKILYMQNFSDGKDMTDKIGHGTHVAGIAAAAKNNIGMQGVAYDAKLVVGKITHEGTLPLSAALNGLVWANKTGADVANLSVGFTLQPWELQPKLISQGQYTTSFTNKGSMLGIDVQAFAKSIPGEMVIVLAAGNDGTKYSNALTTLATATDSKQNLLLNGRVIVAGNYDPIRNRIDPTSSGPQHLCQNTVTGVMNTQYCMDKYRLWDFYILAPGTRIISTVPTNLSNTGLAAMSGTSMAAPVVSGSVAIIHQMWPQMKGENIVKLLLVTANKSIPFYNKLVHGQGLLDLETATRPYQLRGIPTTGRLNGPVLDNVTPIVFTSGSVSIGNKTGVMVVDSFERDYYIDTKAFLAQKQSTDYKFKQTLYTYQHKNPYVLFNNYDSNVNNKIGNMTYNMFYDSNKVGFTPGLVEIGYNNQYYVDYKLSYGFMYENNTWLGNSLGMKANNSSSSTSYIGLNVSKTFDKTTVYGNYYVGMTNTTSHSDTITKINNLYTQSHVVGIEHELNKYVFGMMYYKPAAVYSGSAQTTLPVGLDSNFNIINNSILQLKQEVAEQRIGFYSKYNYKKTKTMLFLEYQKDYLGLKNHNSLAFGINYATSLY